MIHKTAEVASKKIGLNTRIWQFSVILKDATIGNNCNICSHCFVDNLVSIGNNVTIKSGVQIWNGITIEDNVFIGANVTFTNDKYPVSGNSLNFFLEKTIIKEKPVIGSGSTILPGLTIGKNAVIGAGSVLVKSTGKQEVWFGNPAELQYYICSCGEKTDKNLVCEKCTNKKI